ncbi:MAG: hypothetical protein U0P45_05445 [Acidimicrobiales bacterium]
MALPADAIRLTLPAQAPFARVARLAISGLAARSGFAYDEVQDVRIAVGEAFGILVDSDELRLRFTCVVDDDEVEVRAERVPPAPVPPVNELSRQILTAVTDRAEIDEQAGAITFAKRTVLAA